MVPQVKDTESLMDIAVREKLWAKLVMQLQKDFSSANIHIELELEMMPEKLVGILHEAIFLLMRDRFNDYLNLLYIIDVPETEVRAIQVADTVEISAEVSFLILKREWQKVWFKNRR
ncbi:hypothetical protein SAMN02927921_01606 [Sinomicrobium oceani]|uniref:Uncharacterized protein n=1 Tax=Sinomicrobium oceani TaxID=1150368 RepID=A0A1K1P322_9FLAO|nr:hypothetical protein [Sinomicrobium oceani]SFW42186.1 hypothetical protein SAMN02927921_01606 [Sinomicrobium oceani]